MNRNHGKCNNKNCYRFKQFILHLVQLAEEDKTADNATEVHKTSLKWIYIAGVLLLLFILICLSKTLPLPFCISCNFQHFR